ncbi:hypothetical protein Avbf_12442 [Armadillidium vulgare]|nr:hypothetical protein Avbf_12442 [Armadillidium vulgare]
MKVENENDMMLGILQEENLVLQILKIFPVKRFCIYLSHYIFNRFIYIKGIRNFLLYIGNFLFLEKFPPIQPLLKIGI